MTTLYLDIAKHPNCSVVVGRAEFCYYFTPLTFGDAQEFCLTKGGNLASINSANEPAVVEKLFKSISGGTTQIWIGYIDNKSTGINWNWIDGRGGYTNWATNYPAAPSYYLCAYLDRSSGKWYNSNCLYQNSIVCRIVSYYIVVTTALRLLALRGLRALCVRTRAFGPRVGENYPFSPISIFPLEQRLCII